ncbi:MAG: polysaccharide biosynthesis protein [Defluviitaleaceae bacterium]|nr:polysaccharide biosynthesis protein [Defluviitaleaceae bacterium]
MKNSRKRIALYVTADIICIDLALLLGVALWYAGTIPGAGGTIRVMPIETWRWLAAMSFIAPAVTVAVLACFKLYNNLWRYAGIDEMLMIFIASVIITLVLFFADAFLLKNMFGAEIPKRSFVTAGFIEAALCAASRLGERVVRRVSVTAGHLLSKKANIKRVMIVGAGYSGHNLVSDIKQSPARERLPVLFVDDDESKKNAQIAGVRIFCGTKNIPQLAKEYAIDEIIVAITNAEPRRMREILELCTQTDCALKIVPPMRDVSGGYQPPMRDVSIADLLHRDEVKIDTRSISAYIENASVMVTGGGGSIGSELCRQIVSYSPARLIIVDIYENNAFDLLEELRSVCGAKTEVCFYVGSVRDRARMEELFDNFKPGVVFHAAAHKHVVLMEESPAEAVKNNIFGTINIIECAIKYGTERFVFLSTDKAVNPTNIYGATKRAVELAVQLRASENPAVKLMTVRFGNVMGSNASVIPKFKRQIAAGGPVTVYHPKAERFFMTIPEACSLVLQASGMAQSGRIFILDMGERVNIGDLAKKLIKLSGFKPDEDIKIIYTGLLPGEKLYEELTLPEEEAAGIENTCFSKIRSALPVPIDAEKFEASLTQLQSLVYGDPDKISGVLQSMPLNYKKINYKI